MVISQDLKVEVVALVNDTVGTLMACSSIYPDCKAGVILGTGNENKGFVRCFWIVSLTLGTNACYFESLDNFTRWTGERDNATKQVIINTEWGALGKVNL